MVGENTNAGEAAIKERLKAEIERMSEADLQNVQKSESSFRDWIKRTVKSILNAVMDTVVESVVQWLRGVISGKH